VTIIREFAGYRNTGYGKKSFDGVGYAVYIFCGLLDIKHFSALH